MLNFSIFSNILSITPYILTLFGSIYIYLRLNFYSVKNYATKYEFNPSLSQTGSFKTILLFLNTLLFVVIYLSNEVTSNLNIFKITLLLLICYSFLLSNVNIYNKHWLFGSFFSIIFSALLLKNENIFNFFFILEINTYLFLYLGLCQAQFTTNSQNKSIINSTLITFIINFFSSIFIFTTIYYLLYLNGSSIFLTCETTTSFFVIFFLLKLLSGPWVYFGVEVYKGFKYVTLTLYTVIFLVVLIPKMFYFFTNFSISFSLSMYIPIFIYTFFILLSTRNLNSLKIFLAYSTSFNFIYVLIFFSLINYSL